MPALTPATCRGLVGSNYRPSGWALGSSRPPQRLGSLVGRRGRGRRLDEDHGSSFPLSVSSKLSNPALQCLFPAEHCPRPVTEEWGGGALPPMTVTQVLPWVPWREATSPGAVFSKNSLELPFSSKLTNGRGSLLSSGTRPNAWRCRQQPSPGPGQRAGLSLLER